MGRCCSCKHVVDAVAVLAFAGCIGEIPPQQNKVRLTGAWVLLTGVDPDFRQPVGRLPHLLHVGQPWQGEQG